MEADANDNGAPAAHPPDPPALAPPLGGGDIELGNFIEGKPFAQNTCTEAARAILAEIDGLPPGADGHAAAPASGRYGATGAVYDSGGHPVTTGYGSGHLAAGADHGGHAAVTSAGSAGAAPTPPSIFWNTL